MLIRSATAVLTVGLNVVCGGSQPPNVVRADEQWFTERAEETGLDFVHFNGMSGQFYQPEIMGPGVALFDCARRAGGHVRLYGRTEPAWQQRLGARRRTGA